MTFKRTDFMAILVGCLLLAISGYYRHHILCQGTDVILRTHPRTDSHLNDGERAILSYDINWFVAGKMESSLIRTFVPNETLYVTLDTSRKYARIKQVHYDPPSGELYIKGKVRDMRGPMVNIAYGIEGPLKLASLQPSKDSELDGSSVEIIATVDRRGNAVLKDILLAKGGRIE